MLSEVGVMSVFEFSSRGCVLVSVGVVGIGVVSVGAQYLHRYI